ncbi:MULTISPECIES: hypothetical protein [unclassified Bradyrhizobium]|uniref:hypothetical protein n=1 Tax=unclassified Bradyrhizobium TaxID=2631580 RepID=UPI001FF8A3E7|nr:MULTISPECIES: hypothetical protein [unclassified Bradyrhizobium]MCK1536893.1 hypothetical protein [Bradyrhizobium sp. 176]MCK1560196.1 hypothetical protein [Bradyrhizobium sp. 171]
MGTTIGEFLGNEIVGSTRSLKRFPVEQVLGGLEAIASGAQLGGGVIFVTKGQADSHLAYGAQQLALVVQDADPVKNGMYQKSGASGTGSWGRVADLPYEIVQLTVTGGTADAIAASFSPQVPSTRSGKIYLIVPADNNTGAALSINGIAVKNALNSTPAADTFVSGVTTSMIWAGDHYQLLTSLPADTAGVVADAVAARDAASGYATAAASSASALGNQVHQYDTLALATAAAVPGGVDLVRLLGYGAAGDGGEALYRKVGSEPSHAGKFQSADGAWWETAEPKLRPKQFGAAGDGATIDTGAFNDVITTALALRRPVLGDGSRYFLDEKLVVADASGLVLEGDGTSVTWLIWTNADGGIDLTYNDFTSAPVIKGVSLFTTAEGGGTALKITAPDSSSVQHKGVLIEDIVCRGLDFTIHYWTKGIHLVNCWYANIVRPAIKGKNSVITGAMTHCIHMVDCQAPQVRDVVLYHANLGVQATGNIHGEGVNISGGEIVGVSTGIDWSPTNFKPGITIHDMHINAAALCIKMTRGGQFSLHDMLLYKTDVNQTDWIGIHLDTCAGYEVHSIMLATPNVTVGTNNGILIASSTSGHIHDITGELWNGSGALVLLADGASGNKIGHIIRGRGADNLTPVSTIGSPGKDNVFYGIEPRGVNGLAALSTTPSVGNDVSGVWKTQNASATTIVTFSDGQDGQRIEIHFNDANTTIQQGTFFQLKGSTDATPPNGGIMGFIFRDLWRETYRNF